MHKDHKFFSWNFHRRNFGPLRHFEKKPTNGIFKKCRKSTFDRKKSVFFTRMWDMDPILRIRPKTLKRYVFPFTERKNRPNWWKYPKFKKIIFAIFGQKSPKWILRAKIQKALKWPKTFYNPFWGQKTLKATCFDPQNMFLHPRHQYFDFWKKSFFGFFG